MIELELRLGGRAFPFLFSFSGPLDLLLALARRAETPLDRLAMARITGEFLRVLAVLRVEQRSGLEDGEEAELLADFVETAAWLVLLKSRALLLPAPGREAGEPDPAQRELGRALLGRAALQAAATMLGERMEAAGLASGRPKGFKPDPAPASPPNPERPEPNPEVAAAPSPAAPTAADAVAAARRALDAVRARPGADPYPTEAALAQLEARLAKLAPGEPASTEPWFEAAPAPEAQASLFLALLELARLGRVHLHQSRDGGPVYLKRVSDKPLLTPDPGPVFGADSPA